MSWGEASRKERKEAPRSPLAPHRDLTFGTLWDAGAAGDRTEALRVTTPPSLPAKSSAQPRAEGFLLMPHLGISVCLSRWGPTFPRLPSTGYSRS